MKYAATVCICLLILSFSCEKKEHSNESQSAGTSRIKKEIDILTDSMKTAWQQLSTSDDQKLKDIKRLLDEISYTGHYNVLLHDSLLTLHKMLIAKRYNDTTMADSKKIDAYDQSTDSLLKTTFRLMNTTSEINNHPLAKTLVDDIMNADNNLVLYRARYDRWVKQYNEYLDKHENKIKKLGIPYSAYQHKPMFTINN